MEFISCSWRFGAFFPNWGKSNIWQFFFFTQAAYNPAIFLLNHLQANIENTVLKELYERYIGTKPHIEPMIKSFVYSVFIVVLLH